MSSDIVQFVPFRQFRNNPTQLARQTLEEVPRQMLSYFKRNDIKPNKLGEAQKKEIAIRLATNKNIQTCVQPFFQQKKNFVIQKL